VTAILIHSDYVYDMPSKTLRRSLSKKRKLTRRRRQRPFILSKGGKIGNNSVDFYLMAFPGKVKRDRVMYYMQYNHEDKDDLVNVDFIEDLFETMVKSKKPLAHYKTTVRMNERDN
jgi:hypothetical protein